MNKAQTIHDIIRSKRQRNDAEILRMQRESTLLTLLSQDWPKYRPIDFISHNDAKSAEYLGAITVKAMVDSRQAAVDYLSAFTLEPQVMLQGTFTSVYAKAWVTESARDNANTEIDCLGAYWSYGECRKPEIHAYTTINNVRTHLVLSVQNDPARRIVQWAPGMGHILSWTVKSAPGGDAIKYASGSANIAGNVLVYFPAEPGGAAPTITDYLDKSQPVQWRAA